MVNAISLSFKSAMVLIDKPVDWSTATEIERWGVDAQPRGSDRATGSDLSSLGSQNRWQRAPEDLQIEEQVPGLNVFEIQRDVGLKGRIMSGLNLP